MSGWRLVVAAVLECFEALGRSTSGFVREPEAPAREEGTRRDRRP